MSPVVALLTDFGPGSVYVGQMHAVLLREAPGVRVLDLAHDAPAGDVEAGAYLLASSIAHLPEGTVVVVVIDPGVGTDRALLAARAGGRTFVGPDNGVLAAAVRGGVVRRVEGPPGDGAPVSATFHGRDLMAPLAARLAAGLGIEEVGPVHVPAPPPAGPTVEPGRLRGRVLLVDRFGNLVTNLPGERLGGGRAAWRVLGEGFALDGIDRTFADVPRGAPLAYVGSGGHLEIAVHGGHAAAKLGLGVGDAVVAEARER